MSDGPSADLDKDPRHSVSVRAIQTPLEDQLIGCERAGLLTTPTKPDNISFLDSSRKAVNGGERQCRNSFVSEREAEEQQFAPWKRVDRQSKKVCFALTNNFPVPMGILIIVENEREFGHLKVIYDESARIREQNGLVGVKGDRVSLTVSSSLALILSRTRHIRMNRNAGRPTGQQMSRAGALVNMKTLY